jgi:hypothetical protein
MGLKGWAQVLLAILGCVGLGVTADLLAEGRLGPGFLLAVDVSHILCLYGKCGDPVKKNALAAASLMHLTTHFLEAGAGEVLWCFDTIQDPQKNVDRGRVSAHRDIDIAAGMAWLVANR